MPRADVDLVQALLGRLEGDLVELLADEELIAALRGISADRIDPAAEVSFHAAGGSAGLGPYRGFDGLIAGWREWLSTFSSYHLNVESVFPDDDRIVVLVRQTGRTIHGGVDVPSSPSAAVFGVRDGVLTRATFYMDRAEAIEAEGFELPES